MRPPSNLPSLLAGEGARRLALIHLDEATLARERVVGSTDPEALHDYRVSLRRLRSCIRAYRRALRSTVTRQSERRLRRLARATNRARDLEVHLEWLGQQGRRLAVTETGGARWMIERLTAERDQERERMLDLDQRLFPRLKAALAPQLIRFRATIDLASGARRRSMAAVTAKRLRADAARLRTRLRRIRGYTDSDAIHRARIATKHLRYLLEPFAAAVPGGKEAVDQLKALQDGFGDVHDAHVFAGELAAAAAEARWSGGQGIGPGRGLKALRTLLETRGRQAYKRVADQWLGDSAESFFDRIESLAEAVAGLADRDLEIERKFLLTGLPSLEGGEPPVEIEQGYLPGERLVERVRRIESEDGVQLVRTVKEGSGLTRLEVEEPVTSEVFEGLWPLTEGRRLRKRRYRVADGDLTWEIDQFLDRDLVLAEVELPPGRTTEVEVPDWLRPHVEREVTGEEAYSNYRLASHG